MARAYQEFVGHRFGRLTVLRSGVRGPDERHAWACRCDCGTERIFRAKAVFSGHTRSCGCLLREAKRRKLPLADRFAAHVDKNGPVIRPEIGPCHLWTGFRNKDGYGQTRFGTKGALAHRVSFFLANGVWPQNEAMHVCDNPPCVRAEHLVDGTGKENVQDCVLKGRRAPQEGESNGHAVLTEEDVRAIRESGEPRATLAARFRVSLVTISYVRNRRRWKHVA